MRWVVLAFEQLDIHAHGTQTEDEPHVVAAEKPTANLKIYIIKPSSDPGFPRGNCHLSAADHAASLHDSQSMHDLASCRLG